jgi:nitrile hydratase beta subunit
MNGVHDMGGMHGLGQLEIEPNEPVFHEQWEARTFALTRALNALRMWPIDESRYQLEQIPAADYLRMSYYDKWFTRLVALLLRRGIVSAAEIASARADPEAQVATNAFTADRVPSNALNRNIISTDDLKILPRFRAGERVRARNLNPLGHTRLPRYARGKAGTIERDHGVHIFPDTNAHGLGQKRQHVYSVRFAARQLWGPDAAPQDSVYLDLWDDYLDSV